MDVKAFWAVDGAVSAGLDLHGKEESLERYFA